MDPSASGLGIGGRSRLAVAGRDTARHPNAGLRVAIRLVSRKSAAELSGLPLAAQLRTAAELPGLPLAAQLRTTAELPGLALVAGPRSLLAELPGLPLVAGPPTVVARRFPTGGCRPCSPTS